MMAFKIGNSTIEGPLVLAPMAGYNDQPFRRLCRRFGASLIYTGLMAANTIRFGAGALGTPRSEAMLSLHPDESPLVLQLVGSDARALEEAAIKVTSLGMAMLDVNLGCSAPKIVRSGAGAALLHEPDAIGRIFARLTHVLPLPVSGKIRLGWDESSLTYLDVARAMVDNGAALIAVHGRTAVQGYHGAADWDAIAAVKRAVSIPVLASGDVKVVADIKRISDHTGCDGVMIGRAAIGNPWIFQGRDRDEVPWMERLSVIREHLAMSVAHHGAYHGVVRFRKHLGAYLRGSTVPRRVRVRMMVCDDAVELGRLLAQAGE